MVTLVYMVSKYLIPLYFAYLSLQEKIELTIKVSI
jgi:hypothetical protein